MRKNLLLFTVVFVCSFSLVQVVSAQDVAPYWSTSGNTNATTNSKLGTVNNVPVKFYTNNIQRAIIDSIGRVGIGTPNPVNILTVRSSGGMPSTKWAIGGSPLFAGFGENNPGNADFVLSMASSTPASRPVMILRRSRGTLAVPSAVAANDFLGSLLTTGFDGTNFQNPAAVDFFVDGAPTAGNVPARISFVTGTNSLTRRERLKVGSTGNFNFNDNQLTLQQSTGNVGIGVGNLNFATGMQSIQFANPATTNAAMVNMFASGTTNSPRMVIGHSPTYPTWGLQYVDSADVFNFLSAGNPVLSAQLGSQRVGIGTSQSGAKLDVVGNAGEVNPVIQSVVTYSGLSDVRAISGNSIPADGYGYGVHGTGGYRGGYFHGNGGSYVGGVIGVYGYATGDTGTRYGVYGLATGGVNNWGGYFPTKTYTSELRVGTTNGALGYLVSVGGKLIAEEVRVELEGNWPDYVFKKDYKLMTLEELEARIKANNHLPGIPAAADVKENGIMLGEMQTKTMEKVEELTLYIIQLNNKIKELEKKIDDLNKK